MTTQVLTDDEIVKELEAAGVSFQRFMGGVSGTKDCWSTSGSQDVRKIANGVRTILAKLQAQQPDDIALDVAFLTDLERSRTKYPGNARMFDGLMGEVDELRRAYAGDGDVRAEAFDVAVCAYRIATEGDMGGNTMLATQQPQAAGVPDDMFNVAAELAASLESCMGSLEAIDFTPSGALSGRKALVRYRAMLSATPHHPATAHEVPARLARELWKECHKFKSTHDGRKHAEGHALASWIMAKVSSLAHDYMPQHSAHPATAQKGSE